MKRHRTIAASPVRSAADAWRVVTALIANTLERSPDLVAGSVAGELAVLDGLGPALIAGGHLESNGLVLCDIGLHVTIIVVSADAALSVEENLNAVPGGARATNGWMLHIPLPGALEASVVAAAARSSHITVEKPPESAPAPKEANRKAGPAIDLEAFRKESPRW